MEEIAIMDIVQIGGIIVATGGLISMFITIFRDNKKIEKEHQEQKEAHRDHSSEHKEIQQLVSAESSELKQHFQTVRDGQVSADIELLKMSGHISNVADRLKEERQEQLQFRQTATEKQINIHTQVQAIYELSQEMQRIQNEKERLLDMNRLLAKDKERLEEQIRELNREIKHYYQKEQDRDQGYTMGR